MALGTPSGRGRRDDPLRRPNTIPYAPGALPVAGWGDRLSLGRRRDGGEVLVPLWLPGGGAFHTLCAGATGSGKTRWMLTLMAHAMQLGADIYLVDVVKGVDDRDWLPVHGGLSDAWGSPKEAVAGLRALHADTLSRQRWEPSDPGRFRLIVIDELQAVMDAKGGREVVTAIAAEARSKGCALLAGTQLPTVNAVASSARTNFRVKMAGRLDNHAEYQAALGGRWCLG